MYKKRFDLPKAENKPGTLYIVYSGVMKWYDIGFYYTDKMPNNVIKSFAKYAKIVHIAKVNDCLQTLKAIAAIYPPQKRSGKLCIWMTKEQADELIKLFPA